MIRLTLRQFHLRGELAGAVLVVMAIALAITGPHLAHLYDTIVAPCLRTTPRDCSVPLSVLSHD
jgi:hypothetical protein